VSVADTMLAARWTMAECHLISQHAYERYIDVEPHWVACYIEIWRQWYYGRLSDATIRTMPGARPVAVSGRLPP
jgi:hypothetical protein